MREVGAPNLQRWASLVAGAATKGGDFLIVGAKLTLLSALGTWNKDIFDISLQLKLTMLLSSDQMDLSSVSNMSSNYVMAGT